jgi:hypothetical protein
MDTKQQQLDLHKDIHLQTTKGYEAWLSQAFVDMGKGTVTSDEHVDVKWETEHCPPTSSRSPGAAKSSGSTATS